MCYSTFNPSYEVNGELHYLDSWIYENIFSIYRLYIKYKQEYDLFPENSDWLGIKSISVFENQGFKMNLPPLAQVKTVSPPSVTQVQPKGRPQPIAGNITTVSKSATIPSSSQDSKQDKSIKQVTNISTQDPIKAIKNTMEISVPVIPTPPVSISSSLPTLGHTITDPPMIHAARAVPKPLPNLLHSNTNTPIIPQETLPLA